MSLFGSVYNEDGAPESGLTPDDAPVTLQELAAGLAAQAEDAVEDPVEEEPHPKSEPGPFIQPEAIEAVEAVHHGVAASFAALNSVPADPVPAPEPEPPAPIEAPVTPVEYVPISDDLLPSSSPGRTPSVPSLPSLPSVELGDRQTILKVVLVVLLAVVGFVGFKTFLGGGSEPTPESSIPNTPGEAVDAAKGVASKVDLLRATTAASTTYAEEGTFDIGLAEWSDRLGVLHLSTGGAPEEGILSVSADADAACFETLLANGTVAASAITAEGVRSTTGSGGASLCSVDVAELAKWSPGPPS